MKPISFTIGVILILGFHKWHIQILSIMSLRQTRLLKKMIDVKIILSFENGK
jgi:hypothetical protein